jgi:hypothetical protein
MHRTSAVVLTLFFSAACGEGPMSADPQAWRSFWYAKHAASIRAPIEATEPSPPAEGTRIVLLVPGTTIGSEFFQPMAERLARDGFEPIVWEPPDLFSESLAAGAVRIGREVDRILAESGESRLHIVAECDGGVAARYYVQLLGGHHHVDELVTFVSAHHGSELAPMAAWYTGWAALDDITPGSRFLTRLNTAPMPPGMKLTSIYSCWDEYLWPYTTSRVAGATNVEVCRRYLGHFDGFWDPLVYQRILVTLRGLGAREENKVY